MLLTTHNMEIVNRLKRRVVTMEHGRIVSDRASARETRDCRCSIHRACRGCEGV